MIRAARLALLLLLASALTGCAAFGALRRAVTPLDAYELRVEGPSERAAARSRLHVIVEPPIVTGALDTERILIRPSPLQAQYLPDGQWTDTPAAMLQSALVVGIDATGAFRYVGREPLGPGGDYALITEITDFQAELVGPRKDVLTHLRVSARLVRESDIEVVASRVFEVRTPALSNATLHIVAALDRGMAEVVDSMAAWTVATLR